MFMQFELENTSKYGTMELRGEVVLAKKYPNGS
jgi:hypothetical protein